jgi:hypothetical protein
LLASGLQKADALQRLPLEKQLVYTCLIIEATRGIQPAAVEGHFFWF